MEEWKNSNIYLLEKHFLNLNNIDIEKLFLSTNLNNLETKEQEIFLYIENIIYILKNLNALLKKISFILAKSKKNKTFFVIQNSISNIINKFNLNINSQIVVWEFLALIIILSFIENNLFLKGQLNKKSSHLFEIRNRISEILNNFLIFIKYEHIDQIEITKFVFDLICMCSNYGIINYRVLNEKELLIKIEEENQKNNMLNQIKNNMNIDENLEEILFNEFYETNIDDFLDKSEILEKNINFQPINNIGDQTVNFTEKIKLKKINKQYYKYTILSLNDETDLNILSIKLDLFFDTPEIIKYSDNYYFKGNHYLTISKIFKENIKSEKIFQLYDIYLLEKIKNNFCFLDEDIYNKFSNLFNKKYELEKNNELEILLEKYMINTEKIKLTNFQKNSKSFYQKRNNELQELIIFFYLKKIKFIFKKKIYLSYYFDFRGRYYSKSIISPYSSKMFRFLYTYGEIPENELISFKFDSNKLEYLEILKNDEQVKKLNLNIEKDYDKEIFYQAFFELGKINKNSELQNHFKINIKKFFEIGLKIYKNYNNNPEQFDLKKQIEIEYILSMLKNIESKKKINYIIYKDCTASAFQLLSIILGVKKEEYYRFCNFTDSLNYYDIYTYIIQTFLEKNKISDISKEYFTRKFLKKTIMIYNYSATKWTSFESFSKNFNKNLTTDDYKNLKNDFDSFFNFLNLIFKEGYFFNKSTKELLDLLLYYIDTKKEVKIHTTDNSTAYLEYYIMLTKRTEKKINKKRYSTSYTIKTNTLDIKKTQTAAIPNFIHSLDATIMRLLLSHITYNIITIHDCYGSPILKTNEIITKIMYILNILNIDIQSKLKINNQPLIIKSSFIIL